MVLSVEGLSKTYSRRGDAPVHAVSDMSLSLDAGEIYAFLGPNGAGKTTTIKMIAGLVHPDSGDVQICGYSVLRKRRDALSHVGAVLEGSRNLYWRMTAMENFLYWGGLRGLPRLEVRKRGAELLEIFGLAQKRKDTLQKMSRGMQQRVAICTALLHHPKLLLLDEPTLGLDLEASDSVQEVVRGLANDSGTAILLTTHQMDVAQALARRVCIVREGRIVLEGETSVVLETFSTGSYTVELAEPVAPSRQTELTELGALWLSPASLRVSANQDRPIHEWLQHLDGYRIVRVELEGMDLGRVFRQVTMKEASS